MKSSEIPTSDIDAANAPSPAPIAMPRIGTKKISPKSNPQNEPVSAPTPANPPNCWVFGLLLFSGQLTMAASRRFMSRSCCRVLTVLTASAAPVAVGNFQTVSVAC